MQEEKPDDERIIIDAFHIDISAYGDGERISCGGVSVSFALDGYAVCCNVKKENIAVFARFGQEYAGYWGLNENYGLMVAYDYTENVFSRYKSGRKISYLDSLVYESAENKGTFTYKFG